MAGFLSDGLACYENGSLVLVDNVDSFLAEETAANGNTMEDGTFQVGESTTIFGTDFGEDYVGTAVVDGVTMIVTENASNVFYFYTPPGVGPNTINWPMMLSDITIKAVSSPACFLTGSRISTPHVEQAVETLAIGDLVQTANGGTTPVLWVGRQTVNAWKHGPHMQPVRFRQGALGGGLPHSDLTVTADHGMVLDGLVINASALVNGTTIDFVPMAELGEGFTVYHVETEEHEVILANGAPAETFIDVAARKAFDNYQQYLDLYSHERIIPAQPLPRISSPWLLPEDIAVSLGIHGARDALMEEELTDRPARDKSGRARVVHS